MKQLSAEQLASLAGPYESPEGYYRYIKSIPFLGELKTNVESLMAGQWTEIIIEYTVGGSGLADGAWIKGTFKFYSDWALFQTTHPELDDHVSAEYVPRGLFPGQTPATVQSLNVRFDQKGHERPFQKAVIIDVVDGYMNPGDKIVVRLGDRRFGAKGTRVQTFVEDKFLMRWYIDPVGTSRFAAIKPDIAIAIQSGPVHHLKVHTPRAVRPDVPFPVFFHAEDRWGNVTANLQGSARLSIASTGERVEKDLLVHSQGWTYGQLEEVRLSQSGEYTVVVTLTNATGSQWTETEYISVVEHLPVPRILYGDLHVHSDDTVGTNNSAYNFSYAQKIAALDVIGYTANDFHITKERWDATLALIRQINQKKDVVIFPGTEWCGNSAVGGDHNVVFLDDTTPEFPLDRHGNVARSFEWNEDGPAELTPGAWPLDELYATYAHAADSHLLIPHVGGRRCNLAWHHPQLERLVEIGSAWGHFEWLLQDSVRRGYKMGVCANSDEHRGRCGGGVPGTAVFGTKGGLTGILAPKLEREDVAEALRARHTFATTGERLVGLAWVDGGEVQGDVVRNQSSLHYAFFGKSGFSSIEAYDASGCIMRRDFWQESEAARSLLRVTWGGARLYDRYREAVWEGSIAVEGVTIDRVEAFGGVSFIPEGEEVKLVDPHTVAFSSHTSGDFDGVNITTSNLSSATITIRGTLGGYVKVGNVLAGNPHIPQPTFTLSASWDDISRPGGKVLGLAGGADLFVRVEAVPDVALPRRCEGELGVEQGEAGERAIYFVAREWDGGKVITSPVFLVYE
ncbi:hypothetical protein HDK64DRAFT_341979 [Phyllosticta capitalensis]